MRGSAAELRARLAQEGICELALANPPQATTLPVDSTLICADGTRITVFLSPADLEASLVGSVTEGTLLCANAPDLSWAVGPDWAVLPYPETRAEAGTVAAILGGEIRTLTCP